MSQLSDLTFLRSFASNDPVKIAKYVNMFLNGAGPGMDQIRLNVEKQDWPAVKTAAHSLKSQLKYMGIATGVDKAYFIESSAGEGTNLDKVPEALAELEKIVDVSCAELRQALEAL